MLDRDFAETFARKWVQAWNDRDIDAVLADYAESVVLHSPRGRSEAGESIPRVEGMQALRAYWEQALEAAPNLFFEVDELFVSSDALTLIYLNHRSQRVAETFVFNADGKVIKTIAAYN